MEKENPNEEDKKEPETNHPVTHTTHTIPKEKKSNEVLMQFAIIGILAVLIFYQGANIYGSGGITGGAIGIVSASEIIPTGVPDFYGKELGISYDDVSASNSQLADQTIKVMSNIDRTTTLEGDDLQRYIKIVSEISCEYCCGANSIIFDDGRAACGCAHSYAMRGLGKYLILNHPDMSDDEILSELGKWKVLFFPGIHEQKAQVLENEGIDSTNYINLASNLYRGIEKGQASGGGGMVGGC